METLTLILVAPQTALCTAFREFFDPSFVSPRVHRQASLVRERDGVRCGSPGFQIVSDFSITASLYN